MTRYERQRLEKQRKIVLRCIIITLILIMLLSITLLAACQSNSSEDVDSKQATTASTDEVIHTKPLMSTPQEEQQEEEVTIPTEPQWQPDEADVEAIAKTLWGECRGVPYTSHKAAVVWCILNRVDEGGYFGNSIIEVITKPNQFAGYSPDYPVDPELKAIAEDVLMRWHLEKEGEEDVGRVLPKGYCYFVGDGELNYFTNEWRSRNYWDWSLSNPYES